jgi:hypothetical protein
MGASGTTVTIAAIRIRTNGQSVVEVPDSDPLDEQATIVAYLRALEAEVGAAYPQATVSADDTTDDGTSVTVITAEDDNQDDDVRMAIASQTEEVRADVLAAMERVWERGEFWVGA